MGLAFWSPSTSSSVLQEATSLPGVGKTGNTGVVTGKINSILQICRRRWNYSPQVKSTKSHRPRRSSRKAQAVERAESLKVAGESTPDKRNANHSPSTASEVLNFDFDSAQGFKIANSNQKIFENILKSKSEKTRSQNRRGDNLRLPTAVIALTMANSLQANNCTTSSKSLRRSPRLAVNSENLSSGEKEKQRFEPTIHEVAIAGAHSETSRDKKRRTTTSMKSGFIEPATEPSPVNENDNKENCNPNIAYGVDAPMKKHAIGTPCSTGNNGIVSRGGLTNRSPWQNNSKGSNFITSGESRTSTMAPQYDQATIDMFPNTARRLEDEGLMNSLYVTNNHVFQEQSGKSRTFSSWTSFLPFPSFRRPFPFFDHIRQREHHEVSCQPYRPMNLQMTPPTAMSGLPPHYSHAATFPMQQPHFAAAATGVLPFYANHGMTTTLPCHIQPSSTAPFHRQHMDITSAMYQHAVNPLREPALPPGMRSQDEQTHSEKSSYFLGENNEGGKAFASDADTTTPAVSYKIMPLAKCQHNSPEPKSKKKSLANGRSSRKASSKGKGTKSKSPNIQVENKPRAIEQARKPTTINKSSTSLTDPSQRPGQKRRDASPSPTYRVSHGCKVTMIDEELKVFLIDLVPPDICATIRRLADAHCSQAEASGNHAASWRTLYTYTKMDLPCGEVKDLARKYTNRIMADIVTIVGDIFGKEKEAAMLRPRSWKEPHLLKYQVVDGLPHHTGVTMHYDGCDITWQLMLTDHDEYEGGGTYFRCLKKTIRMRKGQVLVHPGELYHKGVDITKGIRSLIVCFMDGFDPHIVDQSAEKDGEYEENVRMF